LRALALLPPPLRRALVAQCVVAFRKQPEFLGCVVADDTVVLLIGRLSFVLVPTFLAVFAVTLLEEEADLVKVVRGKDRIVMTKSTLGTAEAAFRCHPVLAWHAGLLQAWLWLPH